jgi:hypothetical protein
MARIDRDGVPQPVLAGHARRPRDTSIDFGFRQKCLIQFPSGGAETGADVNRFWAGFNSKSPT